MRVLVTGGAGFIGANLCRELAARPEIGDVIALDDLSTGSAENLRGVRAELVEGSILDRGLLTDIVDAADAVIHLAALPSVPRSLVDPLRTHEVNATGTRPRAGGVPPNRAMSWPRRLPPSTGPSPFRPNTRTCDPPASPTP